MRPASQPILGADYPERCFEAAGLEDALMRRRVLAEQPQQACRMTLLLQQPQRVLEKVGKISYAKPSSCASILSLAITD
jgi:hypothetical protein